MKNTNSPDNAPIVRNIFLHAAAVPVVFDKKNGPAVFCGLVSGYKHPVPGKDRGFDHDRAVIAPAKFSCDERRDSGAPRRTSELPRADCFCSQRYLFRAEQARGFWRQPEDRPVPDISVNAQEQSPRRGSAGLRRLRGPREQQKVQHRRRGAVIPCVVLKISGRGKRVAAVA